MKTFEAVKRELGRLAEKVTVAMECSVYESRSPGSIYQSETWHAVVEIESEGVKVSATVHDGAALLKAIKEKVAAERKRIAEAKRIEHAPKRIEYKPTETLTGKASR